MDSKHGKTPRNFHGKSPRKTMKNNKALGQGKGKPSGNGTYIGNNFLIQHDSNANVNNPEFKGKGKGKGAYFKQANNNANNDGVRHNVNYSTCVGRPIPAALHTIIRTIHTEENDALQAAILANPDLVDEPDARGYTPLQIAVETNNADALTILLTEGGADINGQNPLGDTPLHVATRLKKITMIDELLALHADTTIPNNAGKRPIDVAAYHGYARLIPKFPRRNMPDDLHFSIAYHTDAYDQFIPQDGTFTAIINTSEGYLDLAYDAMTNSNLCVGIDTIFQQSSIQNATFLVTAKSSDDTVLGASSIVFDVSKDYFEIDLFCTDYNYKGIGTAMMNVMKKLKTSMNKNIKLKSVANAHNFYIKQGFTNNAVPHTENGLTRMTYS